MRSSVILPPNSQADLAWNYLVAEDRSGIVRKLLAPFISANVSRQVAWPNDDKKGTGDAWLFLKAVVPAERFQTTAEACDYGDSILQASGKEYSSLTSQELALLAAARQAGISTAPQFPTETRIVVGPFGKNSHSHTVNTLGPNTPGAVRLGLASGSNILKEPHAVAVAIEFTLGE